jgi:hypothetical protein
LKSFDGVGWIPQFQSRFLAELLNSSPDSSIPVPIPVSILGGGGSFLSGVVCVGPLSVGLLLVEIVPLVPSLRILS